MEGFLEALNYFVIGAIIGYIWFPIWRVIKAIFKNAWEATYGAKHE